MGINMEMVIDKYLERIHMRRYEIFLSLLQASGYPNLCILLLQDKCIKSYISTHQNFM